MPKRVRKRIQVFSVVTKLSSSVSAETVFFAEAVILLLWKPLLETALIECIFLSFEIKTATATASCDYRWTHGFVIIQDNVKSLREIPSLELYKATACQEIKVLS